MKNFFIKSELPQQTLKKTTLMKKVKKNFSTNF